MTVVTRFAPSPTGFLHIGGARTALFNWLFARHHGGTFLLRIEDTDRARSTEAAVEAILDGLKWLGLDWDGDAVSQFERAAAMPRWRTRCWRPGRPIAAMPARKSWRRCAPSRRPAGQPMRYDGRWRDRDPAEAPAGISSGDPPEGSAGGRNRAGRPCPGEVRVQNAQLDDMVLLRADGTPTYMLSVVVDDHDMNVTHVIRGDDHLTNTFRQIQIYRAMGWDLPAIRAYPPHPWG